MSAESARAFHLADARKRRAEREAAEVKHTSDHWCMALGWQVLDPDGWDRRNFEASWSEPITQAEFVRRASMSTAWKFDGITDRTDASHGEFKAMLVRFGEADPDAYVAWGEDRDGGDAA